MLFRRRERLGTAERVRTALWPRTSWKRSAAYYKHRVVRLSGSPHAIAAGFAAGVFASFTPLIGFHFLLSFLVAFLVAGNFLAAAIGTAIGNPLTFPLIWVATYNIGSILFGSTAEAGHPVGPEGLTPAVLMQSIETAWPVLRAMLAGGVVLGTVAGLSAYIIVRFMVVGAKAMRRARLAQGRERVAAASHAAGTDATLK